MGADLTSRFQAPEVGWSVTSPVSHDSGVCRGNHPTSNALQRARMKLEAAA